VEEAQPKEELMRRGTIVMVLLSLLGGFYLAGRAEAATARPLVYSKVQSEWPGDGSPLRQSGGIFAAQNGQKRQLTDHPGDREPNVAPDGSTIAFIRDGDVYVTNADGSEQRQLTSGADLDERPQFSPKGGYLIFLRRPSREEPRHLFAVKVDGGEPQQLTSGAEEDFEPSFSPDGRVIVFVRALPGAVGGEFNGNAELFSIRPSGEGLTRLTRTSGDELRPRYFARGIIFQRRNEIHGPLLLFSMRRDGSDVRPLVRRKGDSRVGAVSPNGRLLLFNCKGLWKKRLLPSGRWSRARRLDSAGSENLVFSPDGRRVAGTFANTSSEVSPFYFLATINVVTGRGEGGLEWWEPEEGSRQTGIGSVLGW
jgi:Tol biopolymer transport system component